MRLPIPRAAAVAEFTPEFAGRVDAGESGRRRDARLIRVPGPAS
jgi:hypothetical protein